MLFLGFTSADLNRNSVSDAAVELVDRFSTVGEDTVTPHRDSVPELMETGAETVLETDSESTVLENTETVNETVVIPLLLKSPDGTEELVEFAAHYSRADLEAVVWAFCEKHLLVNTCYKLLEVAMETKSQIVKAVDIRDQLIATSRQGNCSTND